MIFRLVIILSLLSYPLMAQTEIPYSTIPDYPEKYTESTVSARLIDAAGFRFYWATEGLNDTDLAYQPAADGRNTRETIAHIHSLTSFLYTTHFPESDPPTAASSLSASELRAEVLRMLYEIRTFLVMEDPDLNQINLEFPRNTLPYWNVINGPVSDIIYHTGQVVVMRRASGNPVRPGVNVLMGSVNN